MRRARPTLRVLRDDISTDWEDPAPRRAIEEHRYEALHPLSDLPHPIIRKAADSFGEDPAEDNFERPIAGISKLVVQEIKSSQWRGGVWEDPDLGVCWLVVAGLAKGDHLDFEDFYKRIGRENTATDLSQWLPTNEDLQLLKRETAARLRTEWELEIQRHTLEALRTVHSGGTYSFNVSMPHDPSLHLANVELTVELVRTHKENNSEIDVDEIFVGITPEKKFSAHQILWVLIIRVLSSISPPEQGWDRYSTTFSNIGEPGSWTRRVAELELMVKKRVLQPTEPGKESHYTHREHLSKKTIDGKAVRALCGVSFVPLNDHEDRPVCPECNQLYDALGRQ
ncbi:DUF3039 domain-containing protein [Corynebacterium aquatimens]|uniref:DUF3039 domain-containing protein n=1 Tax=Corynebacterium aquatimens TaxID=1190508 RepID=A0A931GSW4_9CORY|nr:DUF3039 domain-containing protein [Corynebacterium aquatimens]MBG6122442.1 hypothetical protein [Corynebacterium aquatimens]